MRCFRTPTLITGTIGALLLFAACDRQLPSSSEPQFHEDEHEPCDLPEVDCVGELDRPASYSHSKNMKLMGFTARTVPFGTSDFNSDLAFWGRTAYQGTYSGFRIIDISQPDNPVQISAYADCSPGTVQGNQGDLLVWENLLIRSWNTPATTSSSCGGQLVGMGFEGLHVFDVSNPLSPRLLASVDLPCGSHTAMVAPDPSNDRLIVYSSPSSAVPACGGLDIVVIPLGNPAGAHYVRTEPTPPAPSGSPFQCHDGSVILGSVNLLACAGSVGFTVWSFAAADGGNLLDPTLLYAQPVAPGFTIGHSAAFTWDGEVIVIGHEPGGGGQARCQLSNPPVDRTLFFYRARTGEALGTFVLPRTQTVAENCTWHNYNVVPVQSRYILVSGNYQSGISVVDFTDPANAREIAFADPAPIVHPAGPTQIVAGGDWSAYWYNGNIYESDMRRGLLVWRLNDPAVAGALRLDHLNPQTQLTSSPLRGR